MLTADLVRATRRGDQLHVQAISGKQRRRAEELAASYLEIAQSQCGGTQHELETAWAEVHVEPREIKLAAGLKKLIEDACELETQAAVEPAALRSQVFLAAAAARSALEAGQRFDRAAVLAQIGAELQLGLVPGLVPGLVRTSSLPSLNSLATARCSPSGSWPARTGR